MWESTEAPKMFYMIYERPLMLCTLGGGQWDMMGQCHGQSCSSLLADWHIKWNNKQTSTNTQKHKYKKNQTEHCDIKHAPAIIYNARGKIRAHHCWLTRREQIAIGNNTRLAESRVAQSRCHSKSLKLKVFKFSKNSFEALKNIQYH